MPLTETGQKVMAQMIEEYGEKRGTSIFYASMNKGVKGSDQWHKKSRPAGKKRMPRLRKK